MEALTPALERAPTIKERILAMLLSQGPATQETLAARLMCRTNSVRRELVEMVRREDVLVLGRRRPGSHGRAAYIYANPESTLTDEEKADVATSVRQNIRPSEVASEPATQPIVFGDALPEYALKWNPDYQRLWRNGL